MNMPDPDGTTFPLRRVRLVVLGLWIVLVVPVLPRDEAAAQVRTRTTVTRPVNLSDVDLQGHRGARGLLPENSVPGFLRALDLGVRTLELDVVITRDREVLVSHEPWMSSIICRRPDGTAIDAAEERTFNVFDLDYDAIAAFDCGSRGHPDFPAQRPTSVSKPLLRDVIRIADGYAGVTDRDAPYYNVEIKSVPEHDDLYHPPPDTFARLVYDVLAAEDVIGRATLQSFDPRALRAVRSIDSTVSLALLVSNELGFEENVRGLGFVPDVYSPHHRLVDERLMEAARDAGVAVVPWTVNTRQDIERMLALRVDGVITDYPDLGREIIDAFHPPAPGH